MKDPIERQAAIARAVPLNLFGREVMLVSVSELENLPSAQPEIIRCKDCKHKPVLDEDGDPEFPTERCPCQCDDYYYSWIPKDDWYCANAERRTDESNVQDK